MEYTEKERSRIKNENDKDAAKKAFRSIYQPDQWSPWNPQGKKKYGRHFLLQLRFYPLSLKKPNNLLNRDDIEEILLKKCIHELPKCKLCTSSLQDSRVMSSSESSDPKKTAETKEMEVVMEMVPYNFLSHAAITALNHANIRNGIPVLMALDMIRLSVSIEGEVKAVQTSVSTSKSDQWTPQNLHGKKKYGREFLLKCHSHPICLKKPKDLSNIEITVEKDPSWHAHCHVCELEASLIPVSVARETRINLTQAHLTVQDQPTLVP